MLNEFDIFLFDFDGTLFDTLESSIYVFEEAYKHIGIKVNHDEVLGYTREPIPNSYKRLVGSMEGYPSFIKDIDDLVHSQKVVDMTKIYSETAEILKFLKANKKIVGIVTSNSKKHVIDILNKFGLASYFDVIVGNREAPNPKPSPEPILKALELLGEHNKEKVVYIGDALNDVIAATNTGITPILLDRLNEFSEYKQYRIINNLEKIER